ncbi:MAG: hypothetical protein L0H25_01605 [Micrococcales bacterium]|nr:hypothetical protein [Micrococcales bacterium]
MRHPQIKPWLRPIGRRHGEVQFGVLPDAAIVSGVTPVEVLLLDRLDGSLSRSASFAAAARSGVSAPRWRRLLRFVHGLGLFAPETDPYRDPHGEVGSAQPSSWPPGAPLPPHAHVLVDGVGTLPESIAALLLRCGARVTQGGLAADLVVAAPHQDPPDVAVLVGGRAVDPRRGDLWLARGTPALPVLVTGPWASVGPLVDAAPGSPCLWCLDLHRTDRDREWPTVLAQLLPEDRPVVTASPREPAPDPALSQLVAGTVALLTRPALTGQRPPPAVSVELRLPWPRMDYRRWARHPRCRRHRGRDSMLT